MVAFGLNGIGKAVTMKIITQHLAPPSKESKIRNSQKRVFLMVWSAKKIAAWTGRVHPILKSFGNARTVGNDNSCRFHTFLKVWLYKTRRLLGVPIYIYIG